MSSRAMYSCDLGGGIMPSAEASDSASDTFERSDAAVEALQLCRFEERRDFLPLGGLLPSSGSKLASCFDCQVGLSSRVFINHRRRERDGGRECERRVFTLGGQSARRKKTERRRLLIPDTLHAPSVSATSQGSRQVTADARVDLRALA